MVASEGSDLRTFPFFRIMTISIAEARKILGPDADRLSDGDIQKILESLYVLANDVLDLFEDGSL